MNDITHAPTHAPTGWQAVFIGRDRPVEAFDAQGNALVADEAAGCLVPANGKAGFQGMHRGWARVVAAVPAQPGWRVDLRDKEKDPPYLVPVVAWAITEAGEGFPMYCDLDDSVLRTYGYMPDRVLPPDAE